MPSATIAGDAPTSNSALSGDPGLSYFDFRTSEEYRGTKQQLQAIGLGCGIPFPGDEGGARRHVKVSDTRGRTWSIWSQRWLGPNMYRALRKKSPAEADASERLDLARKGLDNIVTDPQQVKNLSACFVATARTHFQGLVTGQLAGFTATLRLPIEIRSCLVELIDELQILEEEILACEVEPEPDGIAERDKLQRTVELYANPAFVSVLGTKKTRNPTAPRGR
jgi:hypothetical protein